MPIHALGVFTGLNRVSAVPMSATRPIDYSKWDHIDVSDDDDDEDDNAVDPAEGATSPPQMSGTTSSAAGGRPTVTKLASPSTVTVGPGGVAIGGGSLPQVQRGLKGSDVQDHYVALARNGNLCIPLPTSTESWWWPPHVWRQDVDTVVVNIIVAAAFAAEGDATAKSKLLDALKRNVKARDVTLAATSAADGQSVSFRVVCNSSTANASFLNGGPLLQPVRTDDCAGVMLLLRQPAEGWSIDTAYPVTIGDDEQLEEQSFWQSHINDEPSFLKAVSSALLPYLRITAAQLSAIPHELSAVKLLQLTFRKKAVGLPGTKFWWDQAIRRRPSGELAEVASRALTAYVIDTLKDCPDRRRTESVATESFANVWDNAHSEFRKRVQRAKQASPVDV